MRIDELFDQPLPLTWGSGALLGDSSATFTVDGDEFQISFDSEWPAYSDIDDEDEHIPKEVSVTFGVNGRAHYWDTRDTDTSSNYKRKATSVFSTVAKAIDEYWKKENPDTMFFAASADRQEKTYDMMMKFINRTKPYNIRKKYDPGSDDHYYEITK